jgi:hypothetical protein
LSLYSVSVALYPIDRRIDPRRAEAPMMRSLVLVLVALALLVPGTAAADGT